MLTFNGNAQDLVATVRVCCRMKKLSVRIVLATLLFSMLFRDALQFRKFWGL
jgi:hypothetical protein